MTDKETLPRFLKRRRGCYLSRADHNEHGAELGQEDVRWQAPCFDDHGALFQDGSIATLWGTTPGGTGNGGRSLRARIRTRRAHWPVTTEEGAFPVQCPFRADERRPRLSGPHNEEQRRASQSGCRRAAVGARRHRSRGRI